MQKPVPMAELWRGGLLESTHTGHAVICDDTGGIVESWGDPARVIFPRSSCKMIQALPLMESGAFDAAGLTEAHAAFAAAVNRAFSAASIIFRALPAMSPTTKLSWATQIGSVMQSGSRTESGNGTGDGTGAPPAFKQPCGQACEG